LIFCILKATEILVRIRTRIRTKMSLIRNTGLVGGKGFGTADQFRPSPDELRGLWGGLSQPLERGGSDVTRRGAACLAGQLIHLLVQISQPAAGQHRHGRLDPVLWARIRDRIQLFSNYNFCL
jgi:hypothetical protein